ncbi:MAG: hypothetical protein IIC75_08625, partial [Bacteroidetes bacterium]|nr:hypothetical protein [Bacteroidota bacterium]
LLNVGATVLLTTPHSASRCQAMPRVVRPFRYAGRYGSRSCVAGARSALPVTAGRRVAKVGKGQITTNPERLETYQYLVNCYLQLNENEKAVLLLEGAVSKFPNQFSLKMTLGKLYANSMQVTKAETLFLEIANSQPGNVEAKNMLSKIYFNKALHFFQKENFE